MADPNQILVELAKRLRMLPTAPPANPGPVTSGTTGPEYPIQGWRDAANAPLQALYELGRGFLNPMDAGLNPPAPMEHWGAVLSAIAPVLGGTKALTMGRAAEEAATAGRAAEGAQGIRAYHGSPHDFDKFSLSKIGTGEGQQAYGHGLYFATRKDIAEVYRDTLSRQGSLDVANSLRADLMRLRQEAADETIRRGLKLKPSPWGMLDDAAFPEEIQRDYGAMLADTKRALERAESNAKTASNGRLYEVNLKAEPDALLDWDRPISGQNQVVQRVARQFDVPDNATGRDLHGAVHKTADRYYNKHGQDPLELAAKTLRSKGIPGIKYFDEGSRAVGEGTRNYVIFDDSLVSILKKYGVALPMIHLLGLQAQRNGGKVDSAAVMQAIDERQ